jgi:hypothetical protein
MVLSMENFDLPEVEISAPTIRVHRTENNCIACEG